MLTRSSSFPFIFIFLAALLFAGTGCESRPRHRENMEAPVERPIAMRGTTSFFSSKVVAEATLGRSSGRGGGNSDGSGDSGHGGGGMRGGGRGGSRHGGGGRGGAPSGGSDYGSAPEGGNRQIAGSPLPTLKLRLSFHNVSSAEIDFAIPDVNSDLGNFVVQPENLRLAAGETIEVDPMFSRLGVTSDEIPVTIRLKRGETSETETLVLKDVVPPSSEPTQP